MFALGEQDMSKKILGCGDGPASFNAEMNQLRARVVSCDPIYRFTAEEIESRIAEIAPVVREELLKTEARYLWDSVGDPGALCETRLKSMNLFLNDYEVGCREGRYVMAELPALPFQDKAFDLALASHFLFLYSKHKDLKFHTSSISELLRVAHEVKVYPLVTLEGDISPYLMPVLDHVRSISGVTASIEPSQYRFQKNAHEMLVLRG